MFTIEQIKEAHNKVKSGADFSSYIQKIKKLGVTYYEVFVVDGHTNYYGVNNYKISAPAKYETLTIAKTANTKQFQSDLLAHQQGKTPARVFTRGSAKGDGWKGLGVDGRQ